MASETPAPPGDLTPFDQPKTIYYPMRVHGRYDTEETALAVARSLSPGELVVHDMQPRLRDAAMRQFKTGERYWFMTQREEGWLLFEEHREHESDGYQRTHDLIDALQDKQGGVWEMGMRPAADA